MPGSSSPNFPRALQKGEAIFPLSIRYKSTKSRKTRVFSPVPSAPERCPNLSDGLYERAAVRPPASTSKPARVSSAGCIIEHEINFFPFHKTRREKNLLLAHKRPFFVITSSNTPVSKTQSIGRAISDGASYACLVTK